MVEEQDITGEQTQESAKTRLEMRIDPANKSRIEDMANYAAAEGIIAEDHRGNITTWINYCLNIGEEMLRQYAMRKRGLK